MASRSFVLDEWLLHDLRGDYGMEAQYAAKKLLRRIHGNCDHIVTVKGSPWMAKAFQLMKYADPLTREAAQLLHLGFLRNSRKCKLLEANQFQAVPAAVAAAVPTDDLYLVEASMTVGAEALVTTDGGLRDALAAVPGITVAIKDDFISGYMT